MIDHLYTVSARPITRHGIGSRSLQIRAWAWLARQTDDLAEQMRCLKVIVASDPDQDWAQAALTRVWYRRRRENWGWLPWPARPTARQHCC